VILNKIRLNVARLANLPTEVITIAAEKSRTMEEETKAKEMQRWNEKARELVRSENVEMEELQELVKRLT
jgi:DNA mismatch repair ATPase MutS